MTDEQMSKLWCELPTCGNVDDDVMAFGRALLSASKHAAPVDREEIERARDRVLEQSKNSLFRSGAKICVAEILSPTEPCNKPPAGWTCSRIAGHEGPCAASPAAPAQTEQDSEITEVITQRDHFEEIGTRLAEKVGEHLGVDVGEWTSANDPILTAIEALDNAPPAEPAQSGYFDEEDAFQDWVKTKKGKTVDAYHGWMGRAALAEMMQAQSGDPVAVVDEGDDGLFVEILQGENGTLLKRGDNLYAAPQPAQTAQSDDDYNARAKNWRDSFDAMHRRAMRAEEKLAIVDDLAMLVKKLVRHVRKTSPDNNMATMAMDYLQRNGLVGSPLRDAAPSAVVLDDERAADHASENVK